jgi:hypothetical protein
MTQQRGASRANAILRNTAAVKPDAVSLSFGDPATSLDAR